MNQKYNQKKNISKDAIDLLRKRPWHGNVRELQYLIELLFVTSPNLSITPMDIASSIDGVQQGPAPLVEVLPKLDKKIESIERELINRAYSNGGSSCFTKISDQKGCNERKICYYSNTDA